MIKYFFIICMLQACALTYCSDSDYSHYSHSESDHSDSECDPKQFTVRTNQPASPAIPPSLTHAVIPALTIKQEPVSTSNTPDNKDDDSEESSGTRQKLRQERKRLSAQQGRIRKKQLLENNFDQIATLTTTIKSLEGERAQAQLTISYLTGRVEQLENIIRTLTTKLTAPRTTK